MIAWLFSRAGFCTVAPANCRSGSHMSRSKHSNHDHIRHDSKSRQRESTFRCVNCHLMISVLGLGTQHRNHCPQCLWSKHVDTNPGDRTSICQGKMEPIAVWVKDKLEWALVHRCKNCGELKSNRIGGDDNEFVLMSLASKPIALPPFPLDKIP